MTDGEYLSYTPPLRLRVARALGFRPAPFPFDEAFDFEGKDAIYIRTDVRLSWRDRLRILVSGKVSIATVTRTAEIVGPCQTRSICTVPLWSEKP